MNSSFRSSLLLLLGLFAATSLLAQRSDSSRSTVTLFSGPHYTGERIVLSGEDKLDDFNYVRFPSGRGANNRVSSIRVEGDVEVTLFLYREFSGEQITLHRSISRLSDIALRDEPESWDDNLSSITVRPLASRSREHSRPSPDFVGPVVRPNPATGPSRTDSRRSSWKDDRHNETVKIVRKAYLDVLDREPDSHGLTQYVGIVEDRGWSEDRLRNELRRSREYRDVTVPKQISQVYREVLGREPDSAGKSFYSRQMINRGWTVSRVRDALRRSPEYAQRKSTMRSPANLQINLAGVNGQRGESRRGGG